MLMLRARDKEIFEKIYQLEKDVWKHKDSFSHWERKNKENIFFVFLDKKDIVSSVMFIPFSSREYETFLICSVVTKKSARGKGLASDLLQQAITEIQQENSESAFLLYSEIGAKFYEKNHFKTLPKHLQIYDGLIAMAHTENSGYDKLSSLFYSELPA